MKRINPSISEIVARRWSRRGVLAGGAGMLSLATLGCAASRIAAPSRATPAPTPLTFQSVASTNADAVTVPSGYRADVLIAWGDPLFEGVAPDFDPNRLDRAMQERRFGANNDMLALFPGAFSQALDAPANDRWLLCANHEYAHPFLMFPDLKGQGLRGITGERWAAMYSAVGATIVEIEQREDGWKIARPFGARNRRITAFTPVQFTGPAANHPWIRDAAAIVNAHEPGEGGADRVRCGTVANCAGGATPWGTYLSCEENFDGFLYVSDVDAAALNAARADMALVQDAANFKWPFDSGFDRPGAPAHFDTARNPKAAALYGWTIEIDPYDPNAAPKKRTALGRRKAEGATVALSKDMRAIVYSGDDQAGEFVYKFVSASRYDPADRARNMDLLDSGRLYAARFEEDGAGRWIELTLAAANSAAARSGALYRFRDEADLLMRARLAARLLGATPMDRPEDIEALKGADWIGLGPVLIVCTKNSERGLSTPGNPRRAESGENSAQANLSGHILRIDEADGDLAATRFSWDVFVMAGDPQATDSMQRTRAGAPFNASVKYNDAPTAAGDRFACPDNLALDGAGNIFIATDGSDEVFGDCNDSVLACPIDCDGPRPIKRFLVGPVGCEICGPLVTHDRSAFFAAIQHPGESDREGKRYASAVRDGTAARPASNWPDGGSSWPRPAVVVVRREDGGPVGS